MRLERERETRLERDRETKLEKEREIVLLVNLRSAIFLQLKNDMDKKELR